MVGVLNSIYQSKFWIIELVKEKLESPTRYFAREIQLDAAPVPAECKEFHCIRIQASNPTPPHNAQRKGTFLFCISFESTSPNLLNGENNDKKLKQLPIFHLE